MTIAIRTQEEAQQVLHSIRYIEDYHFPREELEALLAHPEQSVPVMLDKLKNVYQNPRKYATKDNFDMGIVYSYYMLSQLRDTLAFPIMLNLLTLKYAASDDIFGDDLTEACGRILGFDV